MTPGEYEAVCEFEDSDCSGYLNLRGPIWVCDGHQRPGPYVLAWDNQSERWTIVYTIPGVES